MPGIQLKVILMGDAAVGKTALRERYLGKGFQSSYTMTIGADFALKKATVDGNELTFQIWDLAGQPRFDAVRPYYYEGCLGGLLLFDVTRYETFANISKWVGEYWDHNGKGKIPFVLLGNKVDLRDKAEFSVADEEVKEFCKSMTEQTQERGFCVEYLPTSAKTGQNVDEAFASIGRTYFKFAEMMEKDT